MLFDIDNARTLMELLDDDGFVDALTSAEQLVEDVDETLDRVEQLERDATEAVQEANEALHAVDARLAKVDETISLLEAKIEAAFSVGFFAFALNQWLAGDVFVAAGLFVLGLLGASSLVVTVATMPQVRRLRQVGRFASDELERRTTSDGRQTTDTHRRDAGEEP